MVTLKYKYIITFKFVNLLKSTLTLNSIYYIGTTKQNTKSGDAIWSLANNGLDYLDSRTDFWRQQKPIYARRKYNAAGTGSSADSIKNPLNYIIKQLEAIDQRK